MQVLRYVEDNVTNVEELPAGDYNRAIKGLIRAILHLPSEPVWHATISVMCYLTVIGHTLLSVYGKCLTSYKNFNFRTVFYVIDVVIFIDAVLNGINMLYTYKHSEVRMVKRPIILLVIEFLSVIPLEFLSSDSATYCTLTLNRSLRMILIIYFNNKTAQEISSSIVFNRLKQLCSYVLFLMLISYGAYCNIQCHKYNMCSLPICDNDALIAISSLVTCVGYVDNPGDASFLVIKVMIEVSVFYFLAAASVAHFSVAYVSYFYNQINYSSCTLGMISFLRRLLIPKHLIARTSEEFHLVWLMKRSNCYDLSRKGYSTGASFLHPTMYNELMIDIAWVAFKHSHLFRNVDFHYLRNLANYVSLEYKLPGEYLYVKEEWKNKMIYISLGTVEILSNEDQQSSILSLCEGTLMGASTLMFSYKSSHYIRCKTFCEFHILKKSDLIKTSALFPEDYKKIIELLRKRFTQAQTLQESAIGARKMIVKKRENVDPYTLLWVKNTLHRLMATDADSTYRHEFQNIYLTSEVQVEEFNKLLFHAPYLDMLVVRERLEVDMDSVFVRTQFPFVFQQDCIIGIAWECIVVSVTIIVFLAIPYVALVLKDTPDWYKWLIFVITHIYILDMLVQLSTTVKSRHGLTVTFAATAKARIQTFRFWMDVAALLPLDTFMCIITTEANARTKAQLQLNRLLKLHRIKLLFDRWDQRFDGNKLTIRYVKCFCILISLIYLLYCLLGYWHSHRRISSYNLGYRAVLIITKSYLYSDFVPPYFYHFILNLLTQILKIMLFSQIISAYVMENLSKYQVQDIYASIVKVLGPELNPKYGERILRIMELEWQENRCNRIRPQEKVICSMSKATYGEFVSFKIANTLKTIEPFNDFSDELIHDICETLRIVTIPPNEAIAYGGDIAYTVIYLHKGTYNIFDEYSQYNRTQNTPAMINLFEAMMGIPTLNTYISVTNCMVFYCLVKHFRSVLTKHSHSSERFLRLFNDSVDIRHKMMELAKKNLHSLDVVGRIKKTKNSEFYRFKGLIKNSPQEYDYYMPFDRLYPFTFIRYFFMQKTINPHGNFIFGWESIRCICAITTGILCFFIPLTESAPELLLALDFMALADIYVRLHLAYYNDQGILIYHPLATAKNYLKNAFLMDFLGMFPTTLMTVPQNWLWNTALKLNKLLQMYRYFGFFNMFVQHRLTTVNRAYGLTFIPIVLVICVVASNIITVLQCDVTTSNKTLLVDCVDNNAFEAANFTKPIQALQGQLFSIYMACSMLTTAGIQGFRVPVEVKTFLAFLSIVGLFLTITFAGRFIVIYAFTHGTLLKYQSNIHVLLTYLSSLHVGVDFQKRIVSHYEIKWRMLRTKDVHDFLGKVSLPFKYDTLYDLYGARLFETSIFSSRNVGFYRNLTPHLTYDVIGNGGFLGRINDIASDIYILYNGKVNVSSMNDDLEETLYPGSIFGNMHNRGHIRYLVSYRAACHVEVLHLPAKQFFKILELYPALVREYTVLRSIHVKYIPNRKGAEKTMSIKSTKSAMSVVFREHTKRMETWQFFVLVFACYIGTILSLYQIGAQEYSYVMLGTLYFFDIMYGIHYFIKSRTAYTDYRGATVTDLILIKKRWREDKIVYMTRIISLIPFELPFLFLYNLDESTRYLLYGLARSNRYCRLNFIFTYFKQKTYKLNVNIYLIRLGYMLLWSILALLASTTAIILPGSLLKSDNIHPPIPYYNDIYYKNSTYKFQIYITYVHIAANFLTFTPQGNAYPISIMYSALFAVMLVISMHLMYFCYSQMYSLVDQISFYQFKYRETLGRLNNFMKREDVSIALYDRIVNYVQKRWGTSGTDVYPAMLEKAPLYLQQDIHMSVFGDIIMRHEIFLFCGGDLLRQIVGKIRARMFYKSDYIQFEGVKDQCMYFILNGEVNALTDTGKTVKTLKSGNVFGVIQGLYPTEKHTHTYMATKNSMIGILNAYSWLYLLEFFPGDKVRIHVAAENYVKKLD